MGCQHSLALQAALEQSPASVDRCSCTESCHASDLRIRVTHGSSTPCDVATRRPFASSATLSVNAFRAATRSHLISMSQVDLTGWRATDEAARLAVEEEHRQVGLNENSCQAPKSAGRERRIWDCRPERRTTTTQVQTKRKP